MSSLIKRVSPSGWYEEGASSREREGMELELMRRQAVRAVVEFGGGEPTQTTTTLVYALQSEVTNLRQELLEAERTISLLEQLLRNTQIRERELRSDLIHLSQ